MLIYHGKSVCYDIKARKRYEIRQLNTDFVPTEIFVVPKFPKFHLISRASIKRAHLKWPDFGYLETKFQIKKKNDDHVAIDFLNLFEWNFK